MNAFKTEKREKYFYKKIITIIATIRVQFIQFYCILLGAWGLFIWDRELFIENERNNKLRKTFDLFLQCKEQAICVLVYEYIGKTEPNNDAIYYNKSTTVQGIVTIWKYKHIQSI